MFLTCLLGCGLPLAVRSQEQDFPGVSKYSYYSQITGHLRYPMFRDGYLLTDGIQWRDKSVFSDSLYADLLPYGSTGEDSLSLGTVGLTYWVGPAYLYGVAGGAWDFSHNDRSCAKMILGAGLRKPLLSWLSLDLYLQGEYDTTDGIDWEVGGYPVNTPWLGLSVHLFMSGHTPRVLETRDRIFFLLFEFLDNFDLDVQRYCVSISRRSLWAFFSESGSSPFEIELQVALVHDEKRGADIGEARVMMFFSTVGDGPAGEARPGVHFNLSFVSGNVTRFEGLGGEIGFGAKQIDTARVQELYFTVFYNYAGYFYRHPSLLWGLGLTGRY
jgi:hypothetical protein